MVVVVKGERSKQPTQVDCKKGDCGYLLRVTVRPLTSSDEPFLWDALYYSVYVRPGDEPPERDIVKLPKLACAVEDWMSNPGDVGFGAFDDGIPVGAAWLRLWNDERHGYGYINDEIPSLGIAMVPGYRGKGIGTRLLQELMLVASRKFPAVSLSVSIENPARRLYEREGFVETGISEGDSITMLRTFQK